MTQWAGDLLRGVGLDRYDINARLKPALLVLLPVFIAVAFWFPQVRTVIGGAISLVGACGVIYLMAQTARRRGRTVERQLGNRVGRRRSAILLTHADNTIATGTKKRYHAFLRTNGLEISTSDEEREAPDHAFERARSAVDWLLEHTRPNTKASLLFDENIAYGFHRNLYGMKPAAITIALLAIVGHGALLAIRPLDEVSMWVGLLLEAVMVALLALWFFVVTKEFVADASLAYAQKLLSQCEATKPPAKRPSASKRAKVTDPGNT